MRFAPLKFYNFHFEVAQNRGVLIFWGGLVCKVQFHLQNLAIMHLKLFSNTGYYPPKYPPNLARGGYTPPKGGIPPAAGYTGYLSNCYIYIRVISYLLSNSWAYPSTWLNENFFCLITDFLEVSSIWRSLTSCVKIFVETKFSTNQCPGNLVQMFIWYRQNLSKTDLKIPPSIIRACTV